MSKHAKAETPLERADRLIWELRIIDRPWNHPRHCEGNETYHNLKSIALEWHSFPQRFLVGIPNPEGLSFARGGRIYMKALAA